MGASAWLNYDSPVEVFSQGVGYELLLGECGLPVRPHAEKEVAAESHPAVFMVPLVNHLPV